MITSVRKKKNKTEKKKNVDQRKMNK